VNLKSKNIFYWTLFDFANTSYSIVVVTLIYAVYFKNVVAEGNSIGDFYWSLGISISMIITAILSPMLGAIADYSAGKKRFLLFFTLLSIIATANLYFVKSGDILLGLTLFVIANIGFESGLVFYDSFLPEITEPKNFGRVSGYGFAMGYLGSLITLAIAFPFIQKNMIVETFPISALFFLVFSLPLFIYIKDSRKSVKIDKSFLKIGFERISNTIHNLPQYKTLSLFLLSFFFYIEGVNTVIFFAGNYASTTLNFSQIDLIIFFIIVQTTAILGSILFGIIADSYGQKKAIILSLSIWLGIILFAYITSDINSEFVIYFSKLFGISEAEFLKNSFYVVGLASGSVLGATQSTSRSLMSKLTPIDKKTEFFGFFSFFGKSSAIFGPLVFGLVSYLSGSQRIALSSLAIFFVIGLSILTFINEDDVEIKVNQNIGTSKSGQT